MSSPVEQIKDRLSIVDVISSYIKLEKSGSNLKACCPFHNEKSPSFFVSPTRGTFHCFGCSKGGDIFTFTEDIEGIGFQDALKLLADRAGIILQKENLEEKGEQNLQRKIINDASLFFEQNLANNIEAKNYLKDRGLKEETIKNFRVGYAPAEWRPLHSFLLGKGYKNEIIEKTGLIIRSEKSGPSGENIYYDRFRGRIMFPIADAQGRIVAFSGRIFKEMPGQKAESISAKYVNSPETELYNKSSILFGYDKAKQFMSKAGQCIVVEGQVDLIMAHQAGTENTVAVSGTALTVRHLEMIKRFTDSIVFAFDSDEAGFNASVRAFKLALAEGIDTKVVKLPEGLDPADLIKKDPKLWKSSVDSAVHIVDNYLDLILKNNTDDRTIRIEASKKVLPLIASISNKIDQDHFLQTLIRKININEESARAELSKIVASSEEGLNSLQYPRNADSISQGSQKAYNSGGDEIKDKILGLYIWQSESKEPKIDLDDLALKYKDFSGKNIKEEIKEMTEIKVKDIAFQAEVYYVDSEKLNESLKELLGNFEVFILEDKLKDFMANLRNAEEISDQARAVQILKECDVISKKINEIKNSRFL